MDKQAHGLKSLEWQIEQGQGGSSAVKLRGRQMFALAPQDYVLGIEIVAMLNSHASLVSLVMQASAPGGIAESSFGAWRQEAKRALEGCPAVKALELLHTCTVRADELKQTAQRLCECVEDAAVRLAEAGHPAADGLYDSVLGHAKAVIGDRASTELDAAAV